MGLPFAAHSEGSNSAGQPYPSLKVLEWNVWIFVIESLIHIYAR